MRKIYILSSLENGHFRFLRRGFTLLPNCEKIGKMAPLTVTNGIFKECQKSSIPYGQGSLNPNITFLGQKL